MQSIVINFKLLIFKSLYDVSWLSLLRHFKCLEVFRSEWDVYV